MKRALVVMMSAFIALNGFSQKNFKDLIGHWEIVDQQGTNATLDIIDSSLILLSYNGEKKKIIDYKIDFTKSPIWFDFSTSDTSSVITVKSLIEILNDNMIKWQLFVDEERTPYFSSTKGEMFYLRKAKPVINTGVVTTDIRQ
jgi:hypothetical protein